MADYEPFLINPQKRKPRKRIKYRANDYEPGMEMAEASEMGIGIRKGRKRMGKRKLSIRKSLHSKRRRAAKKAWATRRKHTIAERRKPMAKSHRRRAGKMRKGSPAAKAWGRKMARLRAAGGKKHRVKRYKAKRHVVKRHVKRHVKRYVKRHVAKKRTVKRHVVKRKVKVTYKRRGFARKHKRHTVAAYKLKGHLFTSPFARTVRPMVRLNPFKRKLHRNPFGEELMVVGSNPRRRRRKYSMTNPRKRKAGEAKMARRRRRVHRNPMTALTNLVPTLLWATGGAFAASLVPKIVFKYMPTMANPWVGYGIKAAVAGGGYYLVDKQFGKTAGEAFIIGAVSSTVANILNDLTTGFFAGLGLGYLGDGLSAFPEQLEAFPENAGVTGYDFNNNYAY